MAQPRPPKEPTPPVTPPVEKPDPPASPVETGCDEVSCVLDRYKLSCCAKFKPAEPAGPPVHSGVPAKLEKSMVTSGISKVKPVVIQCGGNGHGCIRRRIARRGAGHVRRERGPQSDVRRDRERRLVHVSVRILTQGSVVSIDQPKPEGVGWLVLEPGFPNEIDG